jgi:hypothetical protein
MQIKYAEQCGFAFQHGCERSERLPQTGEDSREAYPHGLLRSAHGDTKRKPRLIINDELRFTPGRPRRVPFLCFQNGGDLESRVKERGLFRCGLYGAVPTPCIG